MGLTLMDYQLNALDIFDILAEERRYKKKMEQRKLKIDKIRSKL